MLLKSTTSWGGQTLSGGTYKMEKKGGLCLMVPLPCFWQFPIMMCFLSPNSSSQLYEMSHKAEKPVELHIFGNGEHGFGARKDGALTEAWMDLLENWLEVNGFLAKSDDKMEGIFPQRSIRVFGVFHLQCLQLQPCSCGLDLYHPCRQCLFRAGCKEQLAHSPKRTDFNHCQRRRPLSGGGKAEANHAKRRRAEVPA